MRPLFPLFSNPLDIAHLFWGRLLIKPGSQVIDATVGNGKDTLVLAKLLEAQGSGVLWGMDVQERALAATKELLQKELPSHSLDVHLLHCSHESFPSFPSHSIDLIVYNLGYLPGANKSLTTLTTTTLASLKDALLLIAAGGAISITCYPGHEEGHRELRAIEEFVSNLAKNQWCVSRHGFPSRESGPVLFLLQRALM